jgi:hypothetical protein
MGGGVLVHDGGTFTTMEDGMITGNSAVRRGGDVCNGSTSTMKGGAIFGNSADIGGGVSNVDDDNVFIMEGDRNSVERCGKPVEQHENLGAV